MCLIEIICHLLSQNYRSLMRCHAIKYLHYQSHIVGTYWQSWQHNRHWPSSRKSKPSSKQIWCGNIWRKETDQTKYQKHRSTSGTTSCRPRDLPFKKLLKKWVTNQTIFAQKDLIWGNIVNTTNACYAGLMKHRTFWQTMLFRTIFDVLNSSYRHQINGELFEKIMQNGEGRIATPGISS